MSVDRVLAWLDEHDQDSINHLIDWLKIPSIGTDPAYDEHTRRAAEWCRDHLRGSGFDVDLIETAPPGGRGQPMVFGHSKADPAYKGPRVLFYGHYDVQPPDPLELWSNPPFEPVIKPAEGKVGERIVARGAEDDKGQVTMFLEAMRGWHEVSGKPAGGVPFTIMIEGEEESGSVNLERFVETHKDVLSKNDVVLISDTAMLGRGKPAITYGVRGLVYTEITLHAADQDLHSGAWGGKCPNPLNELAKVLAKLWDADRRVTIPGFYDDVKPLADEERELWKKLGIDEVEALAGIGLGPDANLGEKGYSFTEREWARPTCDINGMWGGYTGEGAKTVIPSHAKAKVSFRLVGDQVPQKIFDAFKAWLNANTPAGCRWGDVIDHGLGQPATLPVDSEELRAAARALKRASGTDAALIKSGGSIPVAGLLKQDLGLDTIFMGFGLEDDRIHSPNEKYELSSFRLGARSHAVLIDELWKLGG
ncbi:MAG: M20/M25/M40 family metallo-hydrolase [Phycisphaeraceae bacterium]|nr:MAG: M20/M25/M40 family metallo-hydrolase [Phycisphaeraceae bacterium]